MIRIVNLGFAFPLAGESRCDPLCETGSQSHSICSGPAARYRTATAVTAAVEKTAAAAAAAHVHPVEAVRESPGNWGNLQRGSMHSHSRPIGSWKKILNGLDA